MQPYDFDVDVLYRNLNDWIQRHPGVELCELYPSWDEKLIRLQYDHPVIDIRVQIKTSVDEETIPITYHASYSRGDFDLSYFRFKRSDAEALTYAYLVASYLKEKGICVCLHPTVDAVAKLKSFLLISGERVV